MPQDLNNSKKFWVLLLMLPFTWSAALWAQAYQLRVYEKGSGRLLQRSEVAVGNERWFSDGEGIISFDQPINSRVTVYRSGYETLEVTLANDTAVSVYLVPQRLDDNNTVIIRGKRNNEVSQVQISGKEAKEIAPRGDPVQVTRLLPGVQTSAFQPALVVRGSEPDDSSYYIDNINVPFVFHTIGGISLLPDRVIDKVEFSGGGFSPRYGETSGGIVSILTSNEIPEHGTSEITVNVPLFSGVYTEQPLGPNEVVSASYRKSYLDAVIKNFVEDDMTVIPGFADAHLRYLRKRDGGYTKVLAISSSDTLTLVAPGGANERGELNFNIDQYFGVLGVEQQGTLAPRWTYTVSPHSTYNKTEFDVVDSFFYLRGWTHRLPLTITRRLEGSAKAQAGVELQYDDFSIDILAPDIRADDPYEDYEDAPQIKTKRNYREGIYAGWFSYDIAWGGWLITPGLRSSYNESIKKNTTDPRVQLSYQLRSDTLLKAAVGRYAKAPQPQETDTVFGNPELGFEVAQHYILGAEHTLNERWFADGQLYYKGGSEMVRSHLETRYANSGQRRSYGFELFLRRNQTERAFGWLSYTLAKTEEKASAAESWGPTKVDQTHIVNLVAFYRLSSRWSLGGKLNIHSGDRFTPVRSSVFNAALAKYQPRYAEEDRYRARLPTYHQVDLYSAYDFLWDRWKMKLRTGVEYLSFGKKAFDVTYNYDYSKESYFSGIPVIPYIELSGVF